MTVISNKNHRRCKFSNTNLFVYSRWQIWASIGFGDAGKLLRRHQLIKAFGSTPQTHNFSNQDTAFGSTPQTHNFSNQDTARANATISERTYTLACERSPV